MNNRAEILARLLQEGSINTEEFIVLYEKEVVDMPNIPYTPHYDYPLIFPGTLPNQPYRVICSHN